MVATPGTRVITWEKAIHKMDAVFAHHWQLKECAALFSRNLDEFHNCVQNKNFPQYSRETTAVETVSLSVDSTPKKAKLGFSAY